MLKTPKEQSVLRENYRKKALDAINNANLQLSICCRTKEVSDCRWWDLAESELYTYYFCNADHGDDSSGLWKGEKKGIQKRIRALRDDYIFRKKPDRNFRRTGRTSCPKT